MITYLKIKWEQLKAWFLHSETILLARLAVFGGAITTWVGYMDWAPLWSFLSTGTDFTWKQILGIGVSVVGAGLTFEAARRRHAPELITESNAKTKVALKKIKKAA